jgi:hypothetical protein
MLLRLLAGSSVLLAVACASQGTASTPPPPAPTASNDADAALAKLTERTDQLPSFTLLYAVHYPDAEQQMELRFRAPDVARLDVKGTIGVQSTWIHSGTFSLRGEDHGAPISAELSLAGFTEDDEAFEAALERDFHGSMAAETGGAAGPIFQIELLPPDQADDHGKFTVSVAWLPHAFHRFSWLQTRDVSSPWRSEEGELTREVAGGGTIRVSKETGFVTRMSHPAGFDFRLVSATEDVGTSVFVVPPAAPGAKDLTPQLAWRMEYGFTAEHSRSAYFAMLRGWPVSDDGTGFDERVKRVFAEAYRPLCLRFDADIREQCATNLAEFAHGFREVNARTDGTQEQRRLPRRSCASSYEQGWSATATATSPASRSPNSTAPIRHPGRHPDAGAAVRRRRARRHCGLRGSPGGGRERRLEHHAAIRRPALSALRLEMTRMPSLVGCVVLLGTWAANDANEAVRALAEKTQQLPAFSATYQVTHFDGSKSELRLYYRAPDRARLDFGEKTETMREWLHGSVLSTRGVDRRGRYAIDRDLAESRIEDGLFDAMLEREFACRAPPAALQKGSPGFRLDFEAPLTAGEDSAIVTSMVWADPKFHLLAWLDGGTAASPWQAEGDEFVRRTAKGGVVRVSKETGFLVSLTHPSGYEIHRTEGAIGSTRIWRPPRGEQEDRSRQLGWIPWLIASGSSGGRCTGCAGGRADSSTPSVATRAWAGCSPSSARRGADDWTPTSPPRRPAQFVEWWRTQRSEAGASAEKRAAVEDDARRPSGSSGRIEELGAAGTPDRARRRRPEAAGANVVPGLPRSGDRARNLRHAVRETVKHHRGPDRAANARSPALREPNPRRARFVALALPRACAHLTRPASATSAPPGDGARAEATAAVRALLSGR